MFIHKGTHIHPEGIQPEQKKKKKSERRSTCLPTAHFKSLPFTPPPSKSSTFQFQPYKHCVAAYLHFSIG